jgi:hypothetical protein
MELTRCLIIGGSVAALVLVYLGLVRIFIGIFQVGARADRWRLQALDRELTEEERLNPAWQKIIREMGLEEKLDAPK